ncbi:helix-turn-helix domain-containing protein [Paenibacillus oryzisoli]|uniref:Schlafen AlbA-2 domain-containing protein n=1 Tax=Paenibacillus oryzisoli TaxID=1850517 RepID=A0A197ZY82_9BACL|nr:ATP-binding protein [Paenibacillus oryzisoli]OAS13955.1 hypothetical protein A8708_11285 [Paenibacillus oryzisoli]
MERIIDMIITENESTYLDFKRDVYTKEKKNDFLKDVIAMANSHLSDDKYIIFGIKDKPGEEKDIIGIDKLDDVATFEEIIKEHIEPDIEIDYSIHEFSGKKVGVFRIINCINRPYILKKKNENAKKQIINEGDSWIRKGTRNCKMARNDLEIIYSQRDSIKELKKEELRKKISSANNELLFVQLYIAEERRLSERKNSFYYALTDIKEGLEQNFEFRRFSLPHEKYQEIVRKVANLVDNYEYSFEKKQFIELILSAPPTKRIEYIDALSNLEKEQNVINNHIKRTREFELALLASIENTRSSTHIRDYEQALYQNRSYIDHINIPLSQIQSELTASSIIGKSVSEGSIKEREQELIHEIQRLERYINDIE